LDLAVRDLDARRDTVVRLRRRFLDHLRVHAAPVVLNGPEEGGLPHTLNLSFPGLPADLLMMNLDLAGVACSTGSACSSGSLLLHGPAGVGKSHLVHALVARAGRDAPDRTVYAVAAREFAQRPDGDAPPVSPDAGADLTVVEDLQHLPAAAVEAFVALVDRCR